MNPETMIYYIPAKMLEKLAGSYTGELTAHLTWQDESGFFALRDCFDHSLRRSRRLLLDDGRRLELIGPSGAVVNQPASPDARFVAELSRGPVRAALQDMSPLRALLGIASGRMRQGVLALVDDEGKTHARAILRELQPDKGRAVVLVALQGLRGYDKALAGLTAALAEQGALTLDEGNLYRAIDPSSQEYSAKPVVDVGRDETAFDAASELIAANLPVARANEDGVIQDLDTEFLHDYRIALRRIRSVLSLFKGVYDADQTALLKQRFSALMAPTGKLRDLDVCLMEEQVFRDMIPAPMHGGLERLFSMIRSQRRDEQKKLAGHLQSNAYEKEISALGRLFNRKRDLAPGPNAGRASLDLAQELIRKRYRRIRRIAADLGVDTPDAEVHELRIECKKLRYLMEFFGPVFPPGPFRDLLKPLKRLQDSLGYFNDYSVQQVSMQAFLDGLGNVAHKAEIAQSVGALIAMLHQRQIAEREKIVDAFAGFNSDQARETFRALLQDERKP